MAQFLQRKLVTLNHHKDAINRHQDERLIIVETAIHRVSCLNRPKTALVKPSENTAQCVGLARRRHRPSY
ncbi:hypothetical protein HUN01_25860 [Nostoc edaphicum CCNP1411]|uniref:Uncharacterized protein n=1 Tax=Nostoc edaphicum CCNP1411 TaxID=1472755 RepID=A0A7D7LDI0_9NOSO|nr:hypothetical protein [Nostoc edaphicum]QMS90836.1 hypothetical protein HUN01_25860 [Nostoc edaphicum CCNP1411]